MAFNTRFRVHRSSLRIGKNAPPLLLAAWNAHGEEAFDFIALKTFPPNEVAARESEAIARLRPALNKPLSGQPRIHGLSPATIKYREKIGLTGSAVFMPPHTNKRRWQVGCEWLSINDMAMRAGLSEDAIEYRLAKGLTGTDLIRPKHRAPRKTYTRRK